MSLYFDYAEPHGERSATLQGKDAPIEVKGIGYSRIGLESDDPTDIAASFWNYGVDGTELARQHELLRSYTRWLDGRGLLNLPKAPEKGVPDGE